MDDVDMKLLHIGCDLCCMFCHADGYSWEKGRYAQRKLAKQQVRGNK